MRSVDTDMGIAKLSGFRSYSQHGEDSKLRSMFGNTPGVCVEVGANDGQRFSNTLAFEEMGWKCVLVEANPKLTEALKVNRRGPVFHCAAAATDGELILVERGDSLLAETHTIEELEAASNPTAPWTRVRCRRLDSILEESGIDRVAFATIDVEGAELKVLRGFSLRRWQPRIVIVENNGRESNVPVRSLMKEQDYVPFLRTGCNDWYARSDDRDLVSTLGRIQYEFWMFRKLLSRTLPAPLVSWIVRLKDHVSRK